MTLPQYLADLPPLSDVISKIEEAMIQEEHQPYGNWINQPLFSDENKDAWTQKQWFRYELFMKAGRAYGDGGVTLLPRPERVDKDIPPDVSADQEPFSPLSMIAAWDLCGYKQRPFTPDNIRLLCHALEVAAKSDLRGLFRAPTGLLEHIKAYSIHHQDDAEPVHRRCYGGAKAADALRDAIIDKVHALAIWSGVGELLDQIDWTDETVLVNLASDPSYATRNSSIPLCNVMYQVDCHEAASAIRLRMLFQEWAQQNIPLTTDRPAFWRKTYPNQREEVSPRRLQAKSLLGMGRFHRALARVCRPTLHPQVPPQISLLDLEMLRLEKPKRVEQLSEPLFRAIGYHYTVVRVHYMLRKLIFDKASATPTWQDRTVDKMSGKPPLGTPEYKPLRSEVPDTAYNRLVTLNLANQRANMTFRDIRFNRISFHFPPINWANYLRIDPDASPETIHFDGPKLRTTLDVACVKAFGCDLIQLMDARYAHVEVGRPYTFQIYPDQASDIEAGYSALFVAVADPDIQEIQHCLFKPGPQRTRERILAPDRTILPDFEGSAPLAQSSHSYLRANPPLLRDERSHAVPATPTLPPVEKSNEEDTPRFHVNSAQMKVVERLLGKREGVVRWSQLINLFKRIGFRAEGMGGSAFHITPVVPGGQSILLYRPHPEPSFFPDQTAAVGSQIAATFGWSVDNFVRQGEAKGDSPEPHGG